MKKGYTASYIEKEPILTDEQKEAFEKEFAETSDSQATYEQIVGGLMKKKGIGTKEAADLTGLNETLFKNLDKPGGNILKRFVISIAVGFQLDVSAISKCRFSPKWNVIFYWAAYRCYTALYTTSLAGLKPVKP